MSLLVLALACTQTDGPVETPETPETPEVAESIAPAPFPGKDVTGMDYPTPAATIDGWRASQDDAAMASHAWGIWAGLTEVTDTTWEDQKLRVYETWPTKNQVQCTGQDDCPVVPRQLNAPEQFHGNESGFNVSVNYDITGFEHLVSQKLYDPNTLDGLLTDGGIGKIQNFPATALALKPVYQVAKPSDGYLRLNTWPGPSDNATGWGSGDWSTCVWIKLDDTTPSTQAIPALDDKATCQDPAYANTVPDNGAGHVVPLADFVSFTVDSDTASVSDGVNTGELAILIAMHVSSREIDQWTWQTFWWSADPGAPNAPSSASFASEMGDRIKGPARHYAACTAYQMVSPAQPYVGGDPDGGVPVYCYNPYLEAGFTNDKTCEDLPSSRSWSFEGTEYSPDLGVETNCMSCHMQSSWTSNGRSMSNGTVDQNAPNAACKQSVACEGAECMGLYTADQYIDAEADTFIDRVTLDALWSVGYIAENNKEDGE